GGSGSSPAPNAGRRGGCRQLVSSGPTGCTSSSPDWPAATHVVLCAWRAWRRAKWPCGPQGTRPKVPNCAPTARVASGLAVDDLDPARATFVDLCGAERICAGQTGGASATPGASRTLLG